MDDIDTNRGDLAPKLTPPQLNFEAIEETVTLTH